LFPWGERTRLWSVIADQGQPRAHGDRRSSVTSSRKMPSLRTTSGGERTWPTTRSQLAGHSCRGEEDGKGAGVDHGWRTCVARADAGGDGGPRAARRGDHLLPPPRHDSAHGRRDPRGGQPRRPPTTLAPLPVSLLCPLRAPPPMTSRAPLVSSPPRAVAAAAGDDLQLFVAAPVYGESRRKREGAEGRAEQRVTVRYGSFIGPAAADGSCPLFFFFKPLVPFGGGRPAQVQRPARGRWASDSHRSITAKPPRAPRGGTRVEHLCAEARAGASRPAAGGSGVTGNLTRARPAPPPPSGSGFRVPVRAWNRPATAT
jgi:hypothetical protein